MHVLPVVHPLCTSENSIVSMIIFNISTTRTEGVAYFVSDGALCWCGGGGEKGSWRKLQGNVMQKELRIKDEVNTTPVDAHVRKTKYCDNTVCPLCPLALSVLCLVFVRTSFLRNPKKNRDIFC